MKIDKTKLIDVSKLKYNRDEEFENGLTYVDIQVAIAKAIIEYRKKNNLTQKEFAEALQMNQSMIAKLEHGNYNPSIKFLFDISCMLSDDYSFINTILERIQKVLLKARKEKLEYDMQYKQAFLKVSEDGEEYMS